MQDDTALLKRMMTDVERQPELHQFAPYWRPYSNRILKYLKRDGLASFRSNNGVGKGFSDVLNIDPFFSKHETNRNMARAWMARFLSKLFPVNILVTNPFKALADAYIARFLFKQSQYLALRHEDVLSRFVARYPNVDTLVGNPAITFHFKDKKIGMTYLHSILTQAFLEQRCADRVSSMMEIGGGFGANVHLLVETLPNLRKVIYLDIPPNLYIGTLYLKHFYGEAVVDYARCEELCEIRFASDNSLEIFCIAPWQLKKVATSLGLFFNANSFQEMSIPIVESYSAEIHRISSKDSCMLLQFYEHTGAEGTIDPRLVVEIFNRFGKFKLAQQPLDVGEGFHMYYSGTESGA